MAKGMYVSSTSEIQIGLTNLLPQPSAWTKSGATLPSVNAYEEFVFPVASGDSHFTVMLNAPVVNHIYYIRCMVKAPVNSTFSDGRFEYWASDANCLSVWAYHQKTDNWEMTSNTKAFTDVSGTWVFRNFVVNTSAVTYRKEPMLIDLTACFGSGNEPTKEWCDANIPYFLNSTTITVHTSTGVSRKVKKKQTGINNVSRKIKVSHVGVDNVARKFFSSADTPVGYTWTFTSNGTFTVPDDGQYSIELHGGGGGGAGGIRVTSDKSTYAGANGGAGGGSGALYTTTLSKGASYTITIGAAGVRGMKKDVQVSSATYISGYNGEQGGTTSFGNLYSVAGGKGGTGAQFVGTRLNRGSAVGTSYGNLASGQSGGCSIGSYGTGGNGGSGNASGSSHGANGQPGAVIIKFLG